MVAEGGVELVGGLHQTFTASLKEVFECSTRGEVLFGDAHGVAHVTFYETVACALVALLHAAAEFVLLLFGEGLTFAEFSLDRLYSVHIVVDDGYFLSVLIHNPLHCF